MLGIGIFELMIIAFVWAIWPLASVGVAREKERDAIEGFLLGLVLGPMGMVIELLLPHARSGNKSTLR